MLLPPPSEFCKVPIVYAKHGRHKASICLIQFDVARFRQNSLGFWILSPPPYWIPDSLSVELGFRIPIVRGNLDSLSRIPDSSAHDSGFLSRGDMIQGWILGEGAGGAYPTPREMTCAFLIQLAFFEKKSLWFIGVEVKHETSLKNLC